MLKLLIYKVLSFSHVILWLNTFLTLLVQHLHFLLTTVNFSLWLADKQDLGGKTLYVPRVEDKNSHMRMLNICSMDDLIANSMEILEPAPVDSRGNQREDGSSNSSP